MHRASADLAAVDASMYIKGAADAGCNLAELCIYAACIQLGLKNSRGHELNYPAAAPHHTANEVYC